jgi:hypothetical protein
MAGYDYERPAIDVGGKISTERQDWLATIGFHLKKLPKHEYAILYHTYHDNMPARDIVRAIKNLFPRMFINMTIYGEMKMRLERRLYNLFCDVAIIEPKVAF